MEYATLIIICIVSLCGGITIGLAIEEIKLRRRLKKLKESQQETKL